MSHSDSLKHTFILSALQRTQIIAEMVLGWTIAQIVVPHARELLETYPWNDPVAIFWFSLTTLAIYTLYVLYAWGVVRLQMSLEKPRECKTPSKRAPSTGGVEWQALPQSDIRTYPRYH
eukprot:gene473-856_t